VSARVHGGPDAFGAAPHDFSTNANACGPCPAALEAVRAADAARYPDPAYTALRERLARRHGVAVARIAVAGSASEFIFRFTAWALRGGARSVWIPRHGYADYGQAAQAFGLAFAERPERADLVWRCEPASPLGTADPAPARDAALQVIDRAYEPLRLEGQADPAPGAWQLWSPNKALGLTGVRGAYAIAPEGTQADGLDALAPSWVLGAHGVALLTAWCEPAVQDWLAASLPTLSAWKARQLAVCERLGWRPLPSQANFFVAQAPGLDLSALRGRGIRLRDCASFGLPGHVRLAVLPPTSQDALQEAMR
jgi:histidinol-phosphate aminotransferase